MDVENLDDLGCPKFSKLLKIDDAYRDCISYRFQHDSSLGRKEGLRLQDKEFEFF